jgi:Cu/Ag efflux pump CusA
MVTATILTLVVIPVVFEWARGRGLPREAPANG